MKKTPAYKFFAKLVRDPRHRRHRNESAVDDPANAAYDPTIYSEPVDHVGVANYEAATANSGIYDEVVVHDAADLDDVNSKLDEESPDSANPSDHDLQQRQKDSSSDYVWFWEMDSGEWQMFDDEPSAIIEKTYAADPRSVFRLKIDERLYEIDLSNMVQVNITTKKRRSIKRISLHEGNRANLHHAEDLATYAITSDNIEREFVVNRKGKIRFAMNKCFYAIDFTNMTLKNLETGTERKIRRVPIGSEMLEPGLKAADGNNPNTESVVTWYWKDDDGTWKLLDFS